jgi:RND family efflux transporter MFP subunit
VNQHYIPPEAEPIDSSHASPDASPPRPISRRRGVAIGAAALIVVGAIGWKVLHHPAAPPAPPPAVVAVAHPLARDVTQWDDYVGRFAASRSVEVRPRVAGAVTAVHFTDGQMVRAGQPLFTIDPRPYAAALAEAQAEVASARSALALAQADAARVAGLTGDAAIAGNEIDSLRAKVRASAAGLAGAQARVRARALDLEFTTVRAPISGRVSNRRIDAGNLVAGGGAGEATLLTTINAVDPIYFEFDASEALFLKAQRDRAAGRGAGPVEVRLQDEADYRWKGVLDFTDNGLDPRSGTIKVRASVGNPAGFLAPGLFGNMRLAGGGKVRAMLVPDAAVQTDQTRKVVMVVGADGVVVAKPVEPGPLVDGLRVVRGGLAPGDAVVVSNWTAAVPGTKVKVRPGRIAPQAAVAGADPAAPTAAQATLD